MRGRKPNSTIDQLRRGDPSKIGKGKLAERLAAEPKATRGLPACPERLDEIAREQWILWAEELKDMKLDRRTDGPILEGACVNYSRAIHADAQIRLLGSVIEDPIVSYKTGEIVGHKLKRNPWLTVSEKAWILVRSFCSEMGLSLASVSRVPGVGKQVGPDIDMMAALTEPRRAQVQ